MIVPNAKVNHKELRNYVSDPALLLIYVDSLIPRYLRHLDFAVGNQRFYVATQVRNMLSLPYKIRTEAAEALVSDIQIIGDPTDFIDFNEVLSECDKAALIGMIEHELGIAK